MAAVTTAPPPSQSAVMTEVSMYLLSTGMAPGEFGQRAADDEYLVEKLRRESCPPHIIAAAVKYMTAAPATAITGVPEDMLQDIADYLIETAMSEAEFARLVLGSEDLLQRLRKGDIDESDIRDIRAHLDAHPAEHYSSRPRVAPAPPKWTEEMDELLVKLWMRGRSKGYIAQRVDRTARAVAIRASRLDLPPRGRDANGFAKGLDLSPPPVRRDQSDEPPRQVRPTPKMRNCMRCGRKFPSHHAGHRICSNCKSSEEFRYLANMPAGATLGWES